jgi:short-subunit dehydrogenase
LVAGIGRQLVKQLLSAHAKVVALSKTQANLDSLKQEVSPCKIDLIIDSIIGGKLRLR